VRFWQDRVRTASAIQEYTNKELSGAEAGLVGYWKFNEGEGTTAFDSSLDGNDGIITGAVRTTPAAPVTP
jgi:hypothetical protein